MQKNRIVVALALAAVMSGGMVMAANDVPSNTPLAAVMVDGNGGPNTPAPAERSAATDIVQVDNKRQNQAPRYVYEQRVPNTCSASPLASLFASLFGMQEIMRPCEPTE